MTDAAQVSILTNPFSMVSQPKLYDGKRQASSGVRLRATGEITLDQAGPTYLCIVPGHSTCLSWQTAPSGVFFNNPFKGHMSNVVDRGNVKLARVVSVGLRLTMINNSDQNEGYWEAARISVQPSDFSVDVVTGALRYKPIQPTDPLLPGTGLAGTNPVPNIVLSNHQTYQSGKLRDLEDFQFKLNSVDNDHAFAPIFEPVTPDMFLDQDYDMVLIKLHGRQQNTGPTQLMYDAVSNQEVIYVEDTSLARLMTVNRKVPNYDYILEKSNSRLPADKIADL
jgi:hypothetical protein